MKTFRELYCERHHCSAEQFARRVFWQTLHWQAWPFAAFIQLFAYDYFSPDRSLIAHAGDATTVGRVREEVREYFWDSANRGWLRRKLMIRVSGERLKNLCRRYLPETSRSTPTARPAQPS